MFKLLAVTSFTVFFPRSETSEPKITMLELDVEQLENEDTPGTHAWIASVLQACLKQA